MLVDVSLVEVEVDVQVLEVVLEVDVDVLEVVLVVEVDVDVLSVVDVDSVVEVEDEDDDVLELLVVDSEVVLVELVEVVVDMRGGTQRSVILRHSPRRAGGFAPLMNSSSMVTGRGRNSGCPKTSRIR